MKPTGFSPRGSCCLRICLILCPENLTWPFPGWGTPTLVCESSSIHRLGAPKLRLHRNTGGAPFAVKVLLTVATSQGNGLSLSFLRFCLGVALDPERVIAFASSLGMLLVSMGLFSTVRNIYCLSWLKHEKIYIFLILKMLICLSLL